MKTFSILSLGCFRNTYDSECIIQNYTQRGWRFRPLGAVSENKKAPSGGVHLLIINTCGFIDEAKKESLAVIREAIALKQRKRVKEIAVAGCLSQRYKQSLQKSFPEIDYWQGIVPADAAPPAQPHLGPAAVGFLKIAEGCFNNCSYCAIPLIKGPLKSKSPQKILGEAREFDKWGVKELNIIGQDITSWGRDCKTQGTLASLIQDILKETKHIRWIRLLYMHPRHMDDSLIRLIADNERMCKYIDLPIQHANDTILKAMNRKTTKSQLAALIAKIRRDIPGCVIRTSVIVGFPGEGREEFQELMDFLEAVQFERLGVFCYSREEGTTAYNFSPQVHHVTKKSRKRAVMLLQKNIAEEHNRRRIGTNLEVLIEEEQAGGFVGRSQFDAPDVDGVVFIKKKGLMPGQFYTAKIIDALEYDLIGV